MLRVHQQNCCLFYLEFLCVYPGRWVLLQNMHGYTRLQHGDTYTGYPHARQLERTLIRFSTIARMVSWPWCSLWAPTYGGCSSERPGSREQSHPLLLPSRCENFAFKMGSLPPPEVLLQQLRIGAQIKIIFVRSRQHQPRFE